MVLFSAFLCFGPRSYFCPPQGHGERQYFILYGLETILVCLLSRFWGRGFFPLHNSSFICHLSSTAAVLNLWSLGKTSGVPASGEVFGFVCFSTDITHSSDVHLFEWTTCGSCCWRCQGSGLQSLHLDVDKEWCLFCSQGGSANFVTIYHKNIQKMQAIKWGTIISNRRIPDIFETILD